MGVMIYAVGSAQDSFSMNLTRENYLILAHELELSFVGTVRASRLLERIQQVRQRLEQCPFMGVLVERESQVMAMPNLTIITGGPALDLARFQQYLADLEKVIEVAGRPKGLIKFDF